MTAQATNHDLATGALPTTRREDLLTVLAGLWLIAGLFLDGYAHQHLIEGSESFLTLWHGAFYSGFGAASGWLSVLIARRPGGRIRDRVPPGYAPAVVGLVAFAVGGVGDSVWHTVLGVEVGIDALLSPTHLLLMAGMMAIVTAPYRATLARGADRKRGLALVSLGVGVAIAAFFLNFVWGLGDGGFRVPYNPANGVGELAVIAGVASILVTTVVLSVAVVLALRLGKPRFGAFTLLFGLVAAAVHVAFDEEPVGIVAAVTAGIVLDSILARPRSGARVAVALPAATAVLWGVYFGVPALGGEMQWPAEIWMGSVVLAILGSGVLAHLGSHLSTDPGGSTPRVPSADRAGRLAPAAGQERFRLGGVVERLMAAKRT